MTFKELVQSKLPSIYLGAKIHHVESPGRHDSLYVYVEGAQHALLITGKELRNLNIDPNEWAPLIRPRESEPTYRHPSDIAGVELGP